MIYKSITGNEYDELKEWAESVDVEIGLDYNGEEPTYLKRANVCLSAREWERFRQWQRYGNEDADTNDEYEYRRALMNGRLITSDGRDVS